MKTRIIQTRFWDDEFVNEVDIYTQHLYIYLLTCQYINICGIFQLPENKIKFEAKFTDIQFNNAKKVLEENERVLFHKGWVYVVKARKSNNYEKSELNQKACSNELDRVPIEVLDYFNSSIDSSIHTTQKPKTINNKSKTKNNKSKTIKSEYEKERDKIAESKAM